MENEESTKQPNIKKELVLKELEKQKGIVTTTCNNTQISRWTFYDWCKNDADFKAKVDEIQEVAIDYVESKLFEKIDGVWVQDGFDEEGNAKVYKSNPSDTAIIFYLKSKAKKRGYVEKVQNEVTVTPSVDLTKLSDEELLLYTAIQSKLQS